ncbi:auxilin-related protein 2-like isoform X2 [Amaranthus tricolor]|uniref:auxilin-related protein 2-like isoform X2 n=1 Tax=Amaranthus tricolor TaxID=29722 RepID=UPI00258D6954|nr:auxilin-related protein 2-like isoform X2 [Amaranthus tricolor]
MNDFQGLLSSDYGFKPQGKAAPMASSKSTSISSNSKSNSTFNFEIGGTKSSSSSSSSSFIDDHETPFRSNRKTNSNDFADLGDVFFSKKVDNNNNSSKVNNSVNFDSIFGGDGGGGGGGDSGPRFSSLPVFDKPVCDDDISSSMTYDDIFSSSTTRKGDAFDDLLGGLGNKEQQSLRSVGTGSVSKGNEKGNIPSFDDLLPGFGSGSATSSSRSGRKTAENSSRGVFDDLDPLGGFGNSGPTFSAETKVEEKNTNAFGTESTVYGRKTSVGDDASQKSSVRSPEIGFEKKMPAENQAEPSIFEMPSVRAETSWSTPHVSFPVHSNASFMESNSHGYVSPSSEENVGSSEDIWLTVSEVPLFTQPAATPPPSRPPPPRPARFSRGESGSFPASNVHKKVNEYSTYPGSVSNIQSPKSTPSGAKGSFASPIDELEEFAMGVKQSDVDASSNVRSSEDYASSSVAAASAAAMKQAMERAEAKFRHAKGVRERENAKASRSRESMHVEKEETPAFKASEREFKENQERLERERKQKEREEEERRQREEEEKRRVAKESEEKEREKRRIERERELARQAVERVAKEARERAAIEARSRAERVAVQRAQAEARERAEKAAVQRAQAEARERAAAGAKERAEKAASEAREKAKAEAREREAREKEAREREAREKEARERAASAVRLNQQNNENDLESSFNMGRASSAPRPRAASSDPFETQFQSKPAPQTTRTSVNSSSSMRKASSSTNIVDDLSSIFGGPSSPSDFQEVEGETEERRRARMERHQRTQERAQKALAEKNARDLEAQREQSERHRIAETLDAEIKRWAAGKEGNLRALLSTLQYVLWSECGWQPVSLTDLITGAAVKKVYRKATLCIHPDKVQQKGATLQQKYVAEKVFDLLKEAWNKLNSEELF